MSVEYCSLPSQKLSELDFKTEFYRRHFFELSQNGVLASDAKELICCTIYQDLTKLFLERFTHERLVYFSYRFEEDRLVSDGYEHLGDIVERYEEAVKERTRNGLPFDREVAECDGVREFKSELSKAREQERPKVFLLVSAPPPPEELHLYHGRYDRESFYFWGRYNPVDQRIEMFAWRNEKEFVVEKAEVAKLIGSEGEFNHPNDLLRRPIFRDASSFDVFGTAVVDMPSKNDFEMAKNEEWAHYQEGLLNLSKMLSTLIVSGADDSVLLKAHLQIEMEFVKWVVDGKVKPLQVYSYFFERNQHREFVRFVESNFSQFVVQYDTKQFSCGSCGGSVFSLFSETSSRFFSPSVLESSIMESAFTLYVRCRCGSLVRVGSERCGECGMTKAEYDRGKGEKAA